MCSYHRKHFVERVVEDNFTDCYKNVLSLLSRFQVCLGLTHVFPVADLFVLRTVSFEALGHLIATVA